MYKWLSRSNKPGDYTGLSGAILGSLANRTKRVTSDFTVLSGKTQGSALRGPFSWKCSHQGAAEGRWGPRFVPRHPVSTEHLQLSS